MNTAQQPGSAIASRVPLQNVNEEGEAEVYLDGERIGVVRRTYSAGWRAHQEGAAPQANDCTESYRADAVRTLVRRVLADREKAEHRA